MLECSSGLCPGLSSRHDAPPPAVPAHVHAVHEGTKVGAPASVQSEPGEGEPGTRPLRIASLPATSACVQYQQHPVALHTWKIAGSMQNERQRRRC